MDEIVSISSDLTDVNGVTINAGDNIMYLGETYVVMDVDKDECGWIIYPCGSNQKTECIPLAEICDLIEKN